MTTYRYYVCYTPSKQYSSSDDHQEPEERQEHTDHPDHQERQHHIVSPSAASEATRQREASGASGATDASDDDDDIQDDVDVSDDDDDDDDVVIPSSGGEEEKEEKKCQPFASILKIFDTPEAAEEFIGCVVGYKPGSEEFEDCKLGLCSLCRQQLTEQDESGDSSSSSSGDTQSCPDPDCNDYYLATVTYPYRLYWVTLKASTLIRHDLEDIVIVKPEEQHLPPSRCFSNYLFWIVKVESDATLAKLQRQLNDTIDSC